MPDTEPTRPAVREVVSVDLAEAELTAVRDLLDQLRSDVITEEHAVAALVQRPVVEPRAHPEVEAIALSQQIVEEMTADRREDLRSAADDAIRVAQAQLAEATRLAEQAALAARREAAEVLRSAAEGAPAPALVHRVAPALALAPVVPAATAPVEDTTQDHERFWREAAQASAARSVGVAPIEVLLPTAALLLVLLAVLLLIG